MMTVASLPPQHVRAMYHPCTLANSVLDIRSMGPVLPGPGGAIASLRRMRRSRRIRY